VSILSGLKRTVSGGHLEDDAFTEIWSTAIETGQPAAHAHFSDCPQCRNRYAAFVGWLDRIHDDARAEADEAFPVERLAAQQAQVMRRLEALERPARVIAFPRFSRPAAVVQSHAQRWVAAAAAAGLVIGLAAGQFVDIRDALGGTRRTPSVAPQFAQSGRANIHLPAQAVTPVSATSISDEQIFFGDEEQGIRLSELRPMDDITPRMRDDRP
jgi:hypothetical protein